MKTIHLLVILMITSALTGWAQEAQIPRMKITSPDFTDGGMIPFRFTGDGEDVNPVLEISGVPAAAKSLALIVDDPDAPRGIWTHWLLWNVKPATTRIARDGVPEGAVQGTNDFPAPRYNGPMPPSGTHRYYFKLYALDTVLNIPAGAKRKAVDDALRGHIIAEAQWMGRYSRK
jgi:Raf kinase inhibitor-like YbhB/YbcL family protein